jgi:hypothetical protein
MNPLLVNNGDVYSEYVRPSDPTKMTGGEGGRDGGGGGEEVEPASKVWEW